MLRGMMLAAVMLVAGTGVADAQRYYARSEMSGLPKVTYTGKWTSGGKSFSDCSGATRAWTASATCTGGNCDPNDKPPTSGTIACRSTCGPVSTGTRWATMPDSVYMYVGYEPGRTDANMKATCDTGWGRADRSYPYHMGCETAPTGEMWVILSKSGKAGTTGPSSDRRTIACSN